MTATFLMMILIGEIFLLKYHRSVNILFKHDILTIGKTLLEYRLDDLTTFSLEMTKIKYFHIFEILVKLNYTIMFVCRVFI